MNLTTTKEAGFTAVELLITLFIAAIFLFAGYQLYTQVLKDGADADATARISNIAYERLRNSSKDIGNNGCVAGSTLPDENLTVSGLSNVVMSVNIACPFTGAINIFLVTVTVTYTDGSSTKTVKHASYESYAN